jgi:hypothetical protein
MATNNPNQAAKYASSSDAKNPMGFCPFQESEIGVIPVRYALDDADERDFQGRDIGLNPLESRDPWTPPFKTRYRPYTLRQLRDGWLYAFNETEQQLD